jgi:hypothetical protein
MNIVDREKATYSFGSLDRLVRREWGHGGANWTETV